MLPRLVESQQQTGEILQMEECECEEPSLRNRGFPAVLLRSSYPQNWRGEKRSYSGCCKTESIVPVV